MKDLYVSMFVANWFKKHWTDLDEILFRDRLQSIITHRLTCISILCSRGIIFVLRAGEAAGRS